MTNIRVDGLVSSIVLIRTELGVAQKVRNTRNGILKAVGAIRAFPEGSSLAQLSGTACVTSARCSCFCWHVLGKVNWRGTRNVHKPSLSGRTLSNRGEMRRSGVFQAIAATRHAILYQSRLRCRRSDLSEGRAIIDPNFVEPEESWHNLDNNCIKGKVGRAERKMGIPQFV